MEDVANRVTDWIQLTPDGHNVYLKAVENSFGCEVDYAMLVSATGRRTASRS